MSDKKTLKGYVKIGCSGAPLLNTFTQDVTKAGNTQYTYVEITYNTCRNNSVGEKGTEMIDYMFNLTPIGSSGTEYKVRKKYIPGSTRVYLDGVRLTPDDGATTYDYTEVLPNKIKLNYVPIGVTNITVEYSI